jgi:hypothetical protein
MLKTKPSKAILDFSTEKAIRALENLKLFAHRLALIINSSILKFAPSSAPHAPEIP